jgi:hypothetical protein
MRPDSQRPTSFRSKLKKIRKIILDVSDLVCRMVPNFARKGRSQDGFLVVLKTWAALVGATTRKTAIFFLIHVYKCFNRISVSCAVSKREVKRDQRRKGD